MEINGGDINGLRGDTFGVKPNELFMDIIGGDKNGIFLHDLIKITEGTVSEGTIFMHIFKTTNGYDIKNVLILHFTQVFFYHYFFRYQGRRLKLESCTDVKSLPYEICGILFSYFFIVDEVH